MSAFSAKSSPGALGASAAGRAVTWWEHALGALPHLVLGGTPLATFEAWRVTANVDPDIGVAMAATTLASMNLAGWMLVRGRRRWMVAVPLLAGVAVAIVAAIKVGPGIEQSYYVARCLDGNRNGCRDAFYHGYYGRDERSMRALVRACDYNVIKACYSLWEFNPTAACATMEANCSSDSGAEKEACGVMAKKCALSDSPKAME